MENLIIFGATGVIIVFLILIGLVFYVLGALGLMTMAEKKKIQNAWLAFIPIGQQYILGKIIEPVELGGKKIEHAPYILLGAGVVIYAGSLGDGALSGLLSLAASIAMIIAMYCLYKMYIPEKAVLYLVLSIVLPFLGPIFIFQLRNKEVAPKTQLPITEAPTPPPAAEQPSVSEGSSSEEQGEQNL